MNGVAVVVLCFSMGLVDSDCTQDDLTYICQEVPTNFPKGLSSIIFIIKNMGKINSSVFQNINLASVTRLTFTKANITDISAGALGSFRNLTALVVDDSFLSQVSPSWFSEPTGLKQLSLSNNHIEVLEDSMFDRLTGLISLKLSNNMIRTIAPGSLSFQTHLTSLDLSGNQLTYVDPQVFQSFTHASVRLDGNPWDCSCERWDFVSFLKGLRNASLLEREMKVTCESPAHLRGHLAWNVSQCVTPTPTNKPTQPTTSLTPVMLPTLTRLTEKPTQPMLSTSPVTMPTLIGLIVVLCVLLFVVCALGGIYRKKRKNKQVRPRYGLKEEIDAEQPNTQRKPYQKYTDPTEVLNWDFDVVFGASRPPVRTKSANAVLSTSLFCGGGGEVHRMHTVIETPSNIPKESKNIRKQLVGCGENAQNSTSTINLGEFKAEKHLTASSATHLTMNIGAQDYDRDAPSTRNSSQSNSKVNKDTETIPYLSIGTDPTKANGGRERDQHYDSKGQSVHIETIIGRVSTWPPTYSQWKARYATSITVIEPTCISNKKGRIEAFAEALQVLDSKQNVPVSINPFIIISDFTEPLTGSAELVSEPQKSSEPPTYSAELLTEPPNSTEPPTVSAEPLSELSNSTEPPIVSAEPLSEPPNCTEPPTGSAELLSEPSNSTEPPTGSADLLSEPSNSTEPPTGSAELLSEPSNSTEPPTGSTELLSEPPNCTELSVDFRHSQSCHVSYETASTEFDVRSEDGYAYRSLSRKIQNQNQMILSRAEKFDDKPEEITDLIQCPVNQTAMAEILKMGPERILEPLGSAQSPPSGGSPNDETLLVNNEYVFIGLLHEVVQNHGRWTRERWRQTNINKQLYRHKGQGH